MPMKSIRLRATSYLRPRRNQRLQTFSDICPAKQSEDGDRSASKVSVSINPRGRHCSLKRRLCISQHFALKRDQFDPGRIKRSKVPQNIVESIGLLKLQCRCQL